MVLHSIQVGQPAPLVFENRTLISGIRKLPISGPAVVRMSGLDGDGQAEPKSHGGIHKAVYAYGLDAYELWNASGEMPPQVPLAPGGMGENLTFTELDEAATYSGDIYSLGKVILEATEPRIPCIKLSALHQDPTMVSRFYRIGRCGVYFRVIQEGIVHRGEKLCLQERSQSIMSIRQMFLLAMPKSQPEDSSTSEVEEALRRKLQSQLPRFSLSESWSRRLSNFLAG